MKLSRIPYYIGHPIDACVSLRKKISDRYSIECKWKRLMGDYPFDLDHPKGFCEKQNWLKLHDHNPQYTIMADKYLAKQWVANKLGADYIIPTLAVYETTDEIDLNQLPEQFVLKCNHDSGSTIVCKDKRNINIEEVKRNLSIWLSRNYYEEDGRQWVYKNIKPIVIAEKYIDTQKACAKPINSDNSDGDALITYKFMCFNGAPKIMYITVKNDDIWEDYYDMDFQPLDIKRKYRHSGMQMSKPSKWEEMKLIAKKLSEGIPFVRIDLYEIDGNVKFSECTFYDWGGYCVFDNEWEKRLGEWIKLPIDR